MLRYLRPRSLLPRVPLRAPLPLHRHTRAQSTQRVQFVNPLFTARRVKTYIAFGAAFFIFFEVLDIAVEDEEEDEDHSTAQPSKIAREALKQSSKEKQGPDGIPTPDSIQIGQSEDLEPFFIPMGWPKALPQTYYKGDDPEWQSFLAFNRDSKRGKAVRAELLKIVGAHALREDRRLRQTLGKGKIQVRRAWLEIDYPDGPPPEYERTGLEIGDDYIAWTKRPVTHRNATLLKHSLYPTSVFSSFWASWSTLGTIQLDRIRRYFNLESDLEPKASFRTIEPSGRRTRKAVNSNSTPTSGTTGDQAELSVDLNPLNQASSKNLSQTSDPKESKIGLPLPSPGEDMKQMAGAFKQTLAKTWKPADHPAPRGTFFVSGIFEMKGPNATCILEVIASYHPVERRWVSMGWKVRRLRTDDQRPKA